MARISYPKDLMLDVAEAQRDAEALRSVEALFLEAGGSALMEHHKRVTALAAADSSLIEATRILAREVDHRLIESLHAAAAGMKQVVTNAMFAITPASADLFRAEAAGTMARTWCAVIERRTKPGHMTPLNEFLLPEGLRQTPEALALDASLKPFGLSRDDAAVIMKAIGKTIRQTSSTLDLPGNITLRAKENGFVAQRAATSHAHASNDSHNVRDS